MTTGSAFENGERKYGSKETSDSTSGATCQSCGAEFDMSEAAEDVYLANPVGTKAATGPYYHCPDCLSK